MSVRKTERLSSIAEINPPLSSEVRPDSKVSFVTMSAVSGAAAAVASEEIRDAKECLRGFTPFQRGDVLVAKITPCFENGKIVIANIGRKFGFGSTEFHVVRPDARYLDVRYLLHCLRQPHVRLQGQRRMTGSAGQRRVPAHFLSTFEIPLCTLPEQQRIGGILDAADALRAARREALGQLDTLLQSTFLDMFGDPVTNPMGWEVGVVGDLLGSANYGTSKKPSQDEGQYPVLRMNNITYSGEWDFRSLKFIDLEDKELPKHLVYRGQILFNRTNSKELVGKTAVYRRDEPMAFAGYLVRGIANDSADPEYIGAFMNTPQTKVFLQNKCKNIVGMANINAKEFQAIPIPKPPLHLQRRFAAIVESVEQQKTCMRGHLAELDALFACLQSRAFNGELGGAGSGERGTGKAEEGGR